MPSLRNLSARTFAVVTYTVGRSGHIVSARSSSAPRSFACPPAEAATSSFTSLLSLSSSLGNSPPILPVGARYITIEREKPCENLPKPYSWQTRDFRQRQAPG